MPFGTSRKIELSRLRLAAQVFPLSHYLRNQPALAVLGASRILPPEFVIAEIDEVLRNDPWAWDMLYNRRVMVERMKRENP